MKQSATVQQTTRLTPQQMQLATLIQASNEELEQLIQQEVEKNFTLEIDETSGREERQDVSSADEPNMEDGTDGTDDEGYAESMQDGDGEGGTMSNVFVDDDYEPNYPVSADNEEYSPILNYKDDESFRSELMAQLDVMDLTEEEDFYARYLIDSLDEKGYMSRPLKDLVDELDFMQNRITTEGELERILTEYVQDLEPTGVGARDLRECLLLQIQEKKSTPETRLAYEVLDLCFEDLVAHRAEKICQKLKCTQPQLSKAFRIISHLVAKPSGVTSDSNQIEARAAHIKADFRIHEEDGKLNVSLKDGHLPIVRVSEEMKEMLDNLQNKEQKSRDDKAGLSMLRENIAAGNQFISSLAQRRMTLSNVIRTIAEIQKDYFLSACSPESLKPMVLQDVADLSGYDVSTISRVSNSKYIETDYETIAVKDLFTSGIQTEQGVVSNTAVMECLREIIEGEDKSCPMNDESLTAALAEKGYKVARRTVSKYRELMKFPSAKERRRI